MNIISPKMAIKYHLTVTQFAFDKKVLFSKENFLMGPAKYELKADKLLKK